MKATAINVHLDENDEITLRRFEANEQYFIPQPYSCLTIGHSLSIFPKSLDQLLNIADAINKHILEITREDLSDSQKAILQEVTDAN